MLDVSVTAHNSDAGPVNLTFGSTVQTTYFLDNTFYFPQAGLLTLTGQSIPAIGSYTWTYRHSWMSYDMPVGDHGFFGRLEGFTWWPSIVSPAGIFSVIPNAPQPGAATFDFDTVPGTMKALQAASEFLAGPDHTFARPRATATGSPRSNPPAE